MSFTLTATFATATELAAASALLAGGTAAVSTGGANKVSGATSTKTAAAAAKPKNEHTRDEMQAAVTELKEATDSATAKGVIKNVGGVDKMADIPEDKIDAVYDAAKAAIEAAM